jgi:SAM-dependent methyltransferase
MAMVTLLLPGRHVLNTRFQEQDLFRLLRMPLERLRIVGKPEGMAAPVERLVFAVTSANQSNSRYNPVPLEVRSIGVDRFARRLKEALGVSYRIVPIPHFGPTGRFAEFVLKELEEATEGDLRLMPGETLIYSSTPTVIGQFRELEFGVLTGELGKWPVAAGGAPEFIAPTPAEVLKQVVAAGEGWGSDPVVREHLHAATLSVWQDFPDVVRRILRLHRDPLLTDAGSLTEMRNYSTYAQGMGNRAILEVKYQDIRDAIVPGKIVDEGCADGALLLPIARDFPDSDLIGIEITGEFMARCRERQRAQEYGGTYVHFHQRNITEPIFEANSVDTVICNSTTHELWSYGEQAKTLRAYLREKRRQLRPGGRIVIRDVCGPEQKEEEVLLWCNESDGGSAGEWTGKAAELARLSTAERFGLFAKGFLEELRVHGRRAAETKLAYRTETREGRRLFVLPLAGAMEFMSRKDYVDNWASELNEEFTFWSFSQWKRELAEAGFRVLENPNDPGKLSRAYCNPWMVENRFKGKTELFRMAGDVLEPMAYPVTNMVLVGEKG